MVASEKRLGPARRRSTRPSILKPELISNDPKIEKDKLTALQRQWHTKKKREDGAHLGILKLSMLAVARQPPHLADLAGGAWDKRSLSIQGRGKRRDATAASALPKHKQQPHLARRLQGKRRNAEEKRRGTGNKDKRGLVARFLEQGAGHPSRLRRGRPLGQIPPPHARETEWRREGMDLPGPVACCRRSVAEYLRPRRRPVHISSRRMGVSPLEEATMEEGRGGAWRRRRRPAPRSRPRTHPAVVFARVELPVAATAASSRPHRSARAACHRRYRVQLPWGLGARSLLPPAPTC
jgi:hypothetical protein